MVMSLLMTSIIFSASNYYAIGSELGAYIKLYPRLEPHSKSSAIRELGARLRVKRNELEAELKKHDPENKGLITVSKWCEAMRKATNLGLPWHLYRPRLALSVYDGPDNEVNYLITLVLLDTDTIVSTNI
ncbi:hypothetical protein DOY81_015370 [Sarcophaga bullata]|nr:hypothetical protein DOY81_015370 [Sarcophaga bullata]